MGSSGRSQLRLAARAVLWTSTSAGTARPRRKCGADGFQSGSQVQIKEAISTFPVVSLAVRVMILGHRAREDAGRDLPFPNTPKFTMTMRPLSSITTIALGAASTIRRKVSSGCVAGCMSGAEAESRHHSIHRITRMHGSTSTALPVSSLSGHCALRASRKSRPRTSALIPRGVLARRHD